MKAHCQFCVTSFQLEQDKVLQRFVVEMEDPAKTVLEYQ